MVKEVVMHKTVDDVPSKIIIVCEGHEEATAVRDDLRDYGVYANMDPMTKDWTVIVKTDSLVEKFKKEFLSKL